MSLLHLVGKINLVRLKELQLESIAIYRLSIRVALSFFSTLPLMIAIV